MLIVALAAGGRPAAAESGDGYAAFVAEASQRFHIPEPWIRAVMRVESAGDPRAVSRRGAMGLMQIMPATWDELRARHGLGGDPFDPRDNILAGAAYLREMHDRFRSINLMLVAYNAGPARADAYRTSGRSLPAETRAYIATLAPLLSGDDRSAAPSSTPSAPNAFVAPLFARLNGSATGGAVQTPGPQLSSLTADEAAFLSRSSGLFAAGSAPVGTPLTDTPSASASPASPPAARASNDDAATARRLPASGLFAVQRSNGERP
jgi:hypothetical protein